MPIAAFGISCQRPSAHRRRRSAVRTSAGDAPQGIRRSPTPWSRGWPRDLFPRLRDRSPRPDRACRETFRAAHPLHELPIEKTKPSSTEGILCSPSLDGQHAFHRADRSAARSVDERRLADVTALLPASPSGDNARYARARQDTTAHAGRRALSGGRRREARGECREETGHGGPSRRRCLRTMSESPQLRGHEIQGLTVCELATVVVEPRGSSLFEEHFAVKSLGHAPVDLHAEGPPVSVHDAQKKFSSGGCRRAGIIEYISRQAVSCRLWRSAPCRPRPGGGAVHGWRRCTHLAGWRGAACVGVESQTAGLSPSAAAPCW